MPISQRKTENNYFVHALLPAIKGEQLAEASDHDQFIFLAFLLVSRRDVIHFCLEERNILSDLTSHRRRLHNTHTHYNWTFRFHLGFIFLQNLNQIVFVLLMCHRVQPHSDPFWRWRLHRWSAQIHLEWSCSVIPFSYIWLLRLHSCDGGAWLWCRSFSISVRSCFWLMWQHNMYI